MLFYSKELFSTMSSEILIGYICILCLVGQSLAFADGPPSSVCDSMTPSHQGQAQTSAAPYTLTFSKQTYTANEQIQVSLRGTSGEQFKGFLIQARPSKDVFSTYGTISSLPAGTKNPCNPGVTALSHSSSVQKSSVNFTWTAPSSNVGNIVFVYTVVQVRDTYWVKQLSSALTYQASTTTTTTTTTTKSSGTASEAGGTTSPAVSGSSTSRLPQTDSTASETIQTQTTKPTVTSTSTTQTLKKDGGCGKTVGCFHDCDSTGSCGFLLTWVDNGNDIDLTLSCKVGAGDVYCAIGLSRDDKMGDDSVFACVTNGSQTSVSVSYNEGQSNVPLDDSQFGLTVKSTSRADGLLVCKFSRKKTFSLAGGSNSRRKRSAPSASNYFDVNQDWTLLSAHGKAFSGYLTQHDAIPLKSTQLADFQSVTDISAAESSNVALKVHGILMTVAWLFCATLGIFLARFYKTVWPEGTEWCGQKRWFQIHRFCMVSTFLLTAAGFIIIFVEEKGYVEMEGDSFDNFDRSHPIIGIIVMALVFINPIMALFRPHPGTQNRTIFNIAHTTVGVLAHGLGIVNLFSGSGLPIIEAPSYLRILLYVFVGWFILMEIVSHIYECCNKQGKEEAYEMKQLGETYRSAQMVSMVKKVLLLMHVVMLIGLAITVCVIIGIN